MTIWSEHVWDEIIFKKNAMSLQRRYLCKFPTSSMFSSATTLIVAYNLLMMITTIVILITSLYNVKWRLSLAAVKIIKKQTYQSRWKMILSHHSAFFVISKSVLAHPIHRNSHSNYTACIDGRVKRRTSRDVTISVFAKAHQFIRWKYEKEP